MSGDELDADLTTRSEDELRDEVRRLRAGIRDHRDSSGHDLCWHHPDLWDLLPERVEPEVAVPPWPQFMRGCVTYRSSLDARLRGAPAVTAEYAEGEPGPGAPPEHVLTLEFRLRDRAGTIHVAVGPNLDPAEVGHPLVAPGYDTTAFRGFPVITATIGYEGMGVRAWMGWLQVIERHDDDGTVVSSVDIPPFLEGSPLFTYGYLPTFSDFPANPDHPDGDWVAHAFLVAIPDVVRTRRLVPIRAFRWGYRLVDGRPAERFAPTELTLDTWESHRSLLEADFPDWSFLPAEPL